MAPRTIITTTDYLHDFVISMQQDTTSTLPTTETLSIHDNAQYLIHISPGNLPFWICISVLIVLCCLFGCIWGFVCMRCKLHRLTTKLEAKQRELEELTMQHYLEKVKSMSECSQTASRPSPSSQCAVVTPLMSHMSVPSLPLRNCKPPVHTTATATGANKNYNAQYITISTVDGNGDDDDDDEVDDDHTPSPTQQTRQTSLHACHSSNLNMTHAASLTLDHDVSINTRAATAATADHDHDQHSRAGDDDDDDASHATPAMPVTQHHHQQHQQQHAHNQHLRWLQVESSPCYSRRRQGQQSQHRRSRTESCSAPARHGAFIGASSLSSSYAMLTHERHYEITPDLPVDAEGHHRDRFLRQRDTLGVGLRQDDSHDRLKVMIKKSVILPFNKNKYKHRSQQQHVVPYRGQDPDHNESRDGDRSTHWFSNCEDDDAYLVHEIEKLHANEAQAKNSNVDRQTKHAEFKVNLAHNIKTAQLIEDDIIDAMHKERNSSGSGGSLSTSMSKCDDDHDDDDNDNETMYSID